VTALAQPGEVLVTRKGWKVYAVREHDRTSGQA
jgi:hypothetical protein